ncbi:MAG TPA: PAS domain S-box protein [Hyphomicrobiaceae bacterium]|nr:PAS domain S-box protein [Hyphomicrobiaceae bacterium]
MGDEYKGVRIVDDLARARVMRPLLAAIGVAVGCLVALAAGRAFPMLDTGAGRGALIVDLALLATGVATVVFACFVFAISRERPMRPARRTLTILGAVALGVAVLETLHLAYGLRITSSHAGSTFETASYFWVVARLAGAIGFLALTLGTSSRTILKTEKARIDVAIGAIFGVVAFAGIAVPAVPSLFALEDGTLTWTGTMAGIAAIVVGSVAAWRLLSQATDEQSVDLDAVSHDAVPLAAAAGLWAIAAAVGVAFEMRSDFDLLVGQALAVAASYLVYRGVVRLQIVDVETQHGLGASLMQLGAWACDTVTGRFDTDGRVRELTGLPPHGATLGKLIDVVDPADRSMLQAAWARALGSASGDGLDVSVRLIRSTGSAERWVHISGKPVVENDRVVRVVGVMRDVSEGRRAARALEESAARFQGIVAVSVDAIISMNAEQRIVAFNHGAEVVFGYSEAEVVGQPLTILMPQRFRGSHEVMVETFGRGTVVARRMAERTEIVALRKSGEEFFAEASISKLEAGGERVYTVVLRDVTDQKRAQDALEVEIEARTAELREEMRRREESQAQLVRTQRMEAFGQLTGGVAHDFNNLLTVITGNLELLEMRLEGEKERTLLGRAQDAAEMGARLTSRLLLFARRRTLAPAEINLNEQVIGLAELLGRTLGERITLTTSLEREVWTILADPSEVENAILNLVINARDAMPKGGQLLIETANVTIDDASQGAGEGETRLALGDYVRLSVADTGTGMTDEVKQRAFEPFFSTKEAGRGTGLGLSSIYGLAKDSGGAVTIYSEVGRGTTVNLYLPRIGVETTAPVTETAVELEPARPGERVLLVEDSPEVRATSRGQLEALGYTVVEADSGQVAVDIMRGGAEFAAVFSDVVMGQGLSGFDVARWVAQNRPAIAVVLASGYPDEILRGEDRRALRVELLRKPFTRLDLADALRRAIAAASAGEVRPS